MKAKKSNSKVTKVKASKAKSVRPVKSLRPKQSKKVLKVKDANEPKFIVGIGSSAGGLEALRSLFGSLKQEPSMAFVVVQHLAPTHRSRMVEIISMSTKLQVKEVVDGDIPKSHTLYITPPNTDVFFEKGVLRLSDPHSKIGPKPSVDYFFRSLAENFGESAIGIVLSGTGSDGAMGIRAIKAAGGFTIAQTVQSAKYDGMPKAAKSTGSVDLELSPEEIAKELERFSVIKRSPPQTDYDPYEDIFYYLESKKGACFSNYKQTTIRRRIERRIIATRCKDEKEYAQYLRKTVDEIDLLFQDILISVTAFFRDQSAFEALEKCIEEKIKHKQHGESFRCWVIGCATGEEPYSIAILAAEAMEKYKKNLNIQVFATDLDEQALNIARRGVYSRGSFDNFKIKLREKYFNPTGEMFQIRQTLRDTIIFAKHNVSDDPPFLNTDLVSCRNVLIYFNQKLQEKVFKTIRYSLDKKSILFLGRSETIPSSMAQLFKLVDKNAKIYISQEEKGELPNGLIKKVSRASVTEANGETKLNHHAIDMDLVQTMISGLAPDSLILDENLKVQHLFGNATAYLSFPKGEMSSVLTKLLAQELMMEVNTLVHRCLKTNSAIQGKEHEIRQGAKLKKLKLILTPLNLKGTRQLLLSFLAQELEVEQNPETKKNELKTLPKEQYRKMERELASTKEQLQSLREEYETSNEELQAVNEELQSTNEELQSSNEELETTNEELQSSNEELTTLNQELNVKSSELQLLYLRHQAIQTAIVYPLLIVDRQMQILNFNPAARHLLRINDADIGNNLRSVPTNIDLGQVIGTIESSFKKQKDQKLQYKTKDRFFEIQIQLFHGERKVVDGAVISFVENTEIASILDETKTIKSRLASIIDNTPAMVTMKDLSGVYMFANQRFCELTHTKDDEVVGSTDDELFGAEIAKLNREMDFEVLKKETPIQFEEILEIDKHNRFWTSSKFPLFDLKKRPYSICTISMDITDRVMREQQLQLFRKAISAASNGTIIFEQQGDKLLSTFCSEQFLARFGYSAEKLNGLTLLQFLSKLGPKEKEASLQKIVQQIENKAEIAFTFNTQTAKGVPVALELRTSTMEHKEGTNKHVILSLFDVTQRLQDQKTIVSQQEELIRYGRFSALGEIAAGISHEINTPLNVIATKTDLLRKGVELKKLSDDKIIKVAEDVDRMVKGISSIVHGLKTAAGLDRDEFKSVSLNRLIGDAYNICEFRVQRHGVHLKLELPSEDVWVECYPVQIMQVIINLINNSLDAIQEVSERWIRVVLSSTDKMIEIKVCDSGHGIDPAIAEKIMTPFFTTKKEKKGTGIGLSLSRTIARQHMGDLRLEQGAKNTTFVLSIPKHQGSQR